MARPPRKQARLSLRIDTGAHARLRVLSDYDGVTLTEKVEQLINNEYRWKIGVLERFFTYTGRDFEELPAPLPGPTMIEENERIHGDEERWQLQVKKLGENIEKYMERQEASRNPK